MAKIEIITTDENGGGDACEALWYELAEAALENGHEVSATCARRSARNSRIQNLKLKGALIRHRWSEPKNARVLHLLHKAWRRSGAKWRPPLSFNTAVDLRILNVGTMAQAAMEPWASILTRSSDPYAILIHNNPEIRHYPETITRKLRHILSGARRVYFVSKRLHNNAEEQLLLSLQNARHVQNPVNLTSRETEPWPTENQQLRMATVGRLDSYVKGQIRLLHALSSDKWRARSWELSFFGEGPDHDKIANAIRFYKLSDHVKLRGFVHDVRTSIWKDHHLLVMPSMLEGMPLTLVEAMVCGRPAICSDVGGAGELIRDGYNGFLANSPFATQLSQSLDQAWEHRKTLKSIGTRAHEDAVRFLPENPGTCLLSEVLDAVKSR